MRTCDGSFFPVSYSGAGSRADSLEDVCRALCPNADMALYSFPFGGTVDEAASPTGEPYANLPNAGKFEKAYDPSCSCRRKGQTWAEALADAEARYGHEKHDILVTPEKSAEMARPIIDPKAKPAMDSKGKPIAPNASLLAGPGAAPVLGQFLDQAQRPGRLRLDTATAPVLDANGADTKLSAAAATVSREGSGIAGDDVAERQELQREAGAHGGSDRTRRGQAPGADSRANALARPISGRRSSELRPGLLASQGQAQGVKQRPALAAGELL